MSRRILLLSGSKVHGGTTLQWAEDIIQSFLRENNVEKIVFIPYAGFDYNEYTKEVCRPFKKMGFQLTGIQEYDDPISAIQDSDAIFIGGGNTFKLLDCLYSNNLIDIIRRKVLHDGMPYIGSSAGSNVATCNICTTNDMPIVYPPSFNALNLVSFNINPHYIDADPNSTHMGETRDTRIQEYHNLPGMPPVLGLREGSALLVQGNSASIVGLNGAKLFTKNTAPEELKSGTNVSHLMKE